ncbi:hypothetical protein BAUCODRAFT_30858 [Baudoinia panamericana UAMH 10762]|uniref:Uncharacterized protein n=1 Tax=Baudoinia panamericana (strain UAMH 10762) TaxID=717646 RepID=M2N3P1_BAUPA|nr:uncharacterized protein BAUCODRAFT_30858 [Baudoinia panamericana UAMH 10762]EMC98588.1 hypothetical protein BAUCODRAFT_30858 [Baudoinia panamericana UAMH 10762]
MPSLQNQSIANKERPRDAYSWQASRCAIRTTWFRIAWIGATYARSTERDRHGELR